MATHGIVSDCLSSVQKRSHATHENDTAHIVFSPQNMPPTLLKAISAAFIAKCYFIYEALPGESCLPCSFLAFSVNPVQPGHTQKKC